MAKRQMPKSQICIKSKRQKFKGAKSKWEKVRKCISERSKSQMQEGKEAESERLRSETDKIQKCEAKMLKVK